MEFQVGEPVMHRTYGFGHVIGIEEREIANRSTLCYAISIRDLTVWVPADDQLGIRLRPPTPAEDFGELFAILSGSGEPLPTDRQERKTWLVEKLRDGRAATLCHGLRDLVTYQRALPLNDHDQSLMKRSREALLGEWSYSLEVPILDADRELRRMLSTWTVEEPEQTGREKRFNLRLPQPGKRPPGTPKKLTGFRKGRPRGRPLIPGSLSVCGLRRMAR